MTDDFVAPEGGRMSTPRFRFKGRATGKDPYGYYYPRWDKAQDISVLANTRDEATQKACEMLGDHPRFGNAQYWGWVFRWDTVDEA